MVIKRGDREGNRQQLKRLYAIPRIAPIKEAINVDMNGLEILD